jgi:hypothetical protein
MTDLEQPDLEPWVSTVAVRRPPGADSSPTVRRHWSPAEEAVVEQAKGALMLRYGVGSFEALAALVRWSQDVDVPVVRIARILMRGVCQGRTPPDDQGRWLLRWLEQRLREDIPGQTELERWSEDA